jgi:hypothetical protein
VTLAYFNNSVFLIVPYESRGQPLLRKPTSVSLTSLLELGTSGNGDPNSGDKDT